ncbi:hypothetical protein LG293_09680 [Citricoccus nitrophenolicus]
MTQKQGFALIAEMDSTRNLLAHGIRTLRTGDFVETTRDPVLTMLSIGVEKLYKLTLGLTALDREGSWPNKQQMKSHGHDLDAMHQAVLEELQTRSADKSEYVRTLLADIEADFVIPPLIAALSRYGRGGRFHYLDLLGDAPDKWDSPIGYWQRVEQAAMQEPHLIAALNDAMGAPADSELWTRAHGGTQDRIASALEGLWETIAVCGSNNMLGPAGKLFGSALHPRSVDYW